MSRERNDGLRKICHCPRRAWPKCAHAWHFNFQPKGGRSYRFSLGPHITTKGDARTKANALRAAIENGTFGKTDDKAGSLLSAMTVTTLFAKYQRDYLDPERPASKKSLGYQIAKILRTELKQPDGTRRAFGDWRVDDVTTDVIEQFRAVRRLEGEVAANRDLELLRALCNWGSSKRRKFVLDNPFVDGDKAAITMAEEHARSRRLQHDEGAPLLAACGAHLRAVVECALETGMRRGEILSLQWKQVEGVRVDGTWAPKADLFLPFRKTKTQRDRRIPISTRLKAILDMQAAALRAQLELKDEERLPGDLYVFGTEIGTPIKSVTRAWHATLLRAHGHTPTYRKGANLTPESRAALRAIGLHFHDLRREAGSRWMDGGVPLGTIQKWLGHANVSQTSTYLAGTQTSEHDALRDYEDRLQQRATDSRNQGHQPPLNDIDTNSNASNYSGKAH